MSFSFSLEVLDFNLHLEDISLRSRKAGFFGKKDSVPSIALGQSTHRIVEQVCN
jgi:hypothetical protein